MPKVTLKENTLVVVNGERISLKAGEQVVSDKIAEQLGIKPKPTPKKQQPKEEDPQ